MKPDTTEIAQLWIDIEDHLIPFLKLDAHLRSVYYHLVRRSRLVGQRTVKISKVRFGEGAETGTRGACAPQPV